MRKTEASRKKAMVEPSTAEGAQGSRAIAATARFAVSAFGRFVVWARLGAVLFTLSLSIARLGAALFTMSLPIARLGAALFTLSLPIALMSAASCSGHPPPSLILVAGGDCLFDRRNGSGAVGASARRDRRWDVLCLAAEGSDAFVFNLETTIGGGGAPKPKRFAFRAPAEALLPLTRFAHPVAALANNHSMDFGPEGLKSTIAALDDAGIAHAGAGANGEEAWKEARIDCRGGTVSVLSCGFDDDESSFSDSSGAVLAALDTGKLAERIRQCASSSLAVVVMLHWGIEYDTAFRPSQQRVARILADSGADLVVGTGPHVLQGLEKYHGSLICYSLGNLVFDDLESDETSASALVRMTLVPDGGSGHRKEFEVAPLRTSVVSQGPACPKPEDARRIVEKLARRSPDPDLLGVRRFADTDGLRWYSIRR